MASNLFGGGTLNLGMGPSLLPSDYNFNQSGVTSAGQGQLISPAADPTFASLLEAAKGAMPQGLPSLQGIVSEGATSPLLASILGPALQRLLVPQQQQQQQLTDVTRAAGGLRDSGYGQNMSTLLGQQGLERNDLMSNIIAKTLQTLVSGQLQENQQAFNPMKALSELLGISKPTYVGAPSQAVGGSRSSGGGWESLSPSLGLATPMQGDKPTPPQIGFERGMVSPYPTTSSAPSASTSTPAPAYDPLMQYLLGSGGGGGGGVYQNSPNSWSSAPGTIQSDQGLLGYGQTYNEAGAPEAVDTGWY